MKLDDDRPILTLNAVGEHVGVCQAYDGYLSVPPSSCLNLVKGSLDEGIEIGSPHHSSPSEGEKPREAVMPKRRLGSAELFVQKGSAVVFVG
jgi:hypothetical protein